MRTGWRAGGWWDNPMTRPPNLTAAAREVYHSALDRVASKPWQSYCPECDMGTLLVLRGADLEICREDRCIYCGQAYVYLDWKAMVLRDHAMRGD